MSASAILSPTTSPLAMPSGGSSGQTSETPDSFSAILAGEVAEASSAPAEPGQTPETLPDREDLVAPASEPILPNLWVQLTPLSAAPPVEASEASSPAAGDGANKALAQAAFTATLMPTLIGGEPTEEANVQGAPVAVEDSKAAAALTLEQQAVKRAPSSPAEAALASLRALPGSGALQQATVTQRKSDAAMAGPTIATSDVETDADPAAAAPVMRSPVPAEPLVPAAVGLSAAKGQASAGLQGEVAKPDIQATPSVASVVLADATDIAPVVTLAAAIAEAIVAPAEPLPATDSDQAITATPSASQTSATAVATDTASLSSLSRATIETTANLAAQITNRLAGRSTRFELGLTPEGLGRVDVTLDIDSDGQLSARLAFDNPLAATELRGRADELRRQLEDAGFTLARDALDFSSRDHPPGRGHDQRQQRATAYADRHAAQNDLIDTPAAWTVSPSNMTPRGVDVKV